jgi:hypothetical protein
MLISVTGSSCLGAVFSSTQLNSSTSNRNAFRVQTSIRRADTNEILNFVNLEVRINAGVSLVKLTTDTTADTAHVDDIDFQATTANSTPASGSVNVNFTAPVSPPNFPDPPTFQTVSGTYTARMTVTSLVTDVVQFASSQTAAIVWDPVALVFRTNPNGMFTMSNITINGVFEAIGPTHTESQPFSAVYRTIPQTIQMIPRISIPSANPFGDGFGFTLTELAVTYLTSGSTTLFDQTVDGVRFVATRQSLPIFYNSVPEPSGVALALTALAWAARRRG